MRIYNASSLIKLMQTGFADTQEETRRLLLNTVVEVSGMQANNITGKTITKLVKRTTEVAEDIMLRLKSRCSLRLIKIRLLAAGRF